MNLRLETKDKIPFAILCFIAFLEVSIDKSKFHFVFLILLLPLVLAHSALAHGPRQDSAFTEVCCLLI